MGNCLDVPPPEPKNKLHYTNGHPHYLVPARSPSVAGSVASLPSMYSGYPPYPAYVPPPQPFVAVDPVTGVPYAYPPHMTPMVAPPYYANGMYMDDMYDYYNEGVEITTSKKHRRRRHRRENGAAVPDKNANTEYKNPNSTVITTYPDPTNDVVKRGNEVISTGNVVKTTETEQVVVTRTSMVNSSPNEDGVVMDEIHLTPVTSNVGPIPGRGNTYITYIEERQPTPPPPEPESTEEIVVEETTTVTTTQMKTTSKQEGDDNVSTGGESTEEIEKTIGFTEIGDADGDVVALLVDEDVAETTTSQEVTSTMTSTYVSSELLKLTSAKSDPKYRPRDIVICFNAVDEPAMNKIRANIQSFGLSVWALTDDQKITGPDVTCTPQAIVDAKVAVVLLSVWATKSRNLVDEVALAHLSDTSLFPVSLDPTLDVLASMGIPLKLQLAGYKWTELAGAENPDILVDFMVKHIKEELEIISSYDVIDEDFGKVSSWAQRRHKIVRQRQMIRSVDLSKHVPASQYWITAFDQPEDKHSVSWERFQQTFKRDYRELLNSSIPRFGVPHLMEALRREIGVEEGEDLVYKAQFIEFCTEEGSDHDVWENVRSLAREINALRQVFDPESTVRMVAIENTGKFGSPNVMPVLRDLLKDTDPNIRAVTTVSIARCMLPSDQETMAALLITLDDPDRFVREAGCIAMGLLRAQEAVKKLVHLWRNDVISRVRDAAATALREIGGEEVESAMRVTHLLSDEMHTLSANSE